MSAESRRGFIRDVAIVGAGAGAGVLWSNRELYAPHHPITEEALQLVEAEAKKIEDRISYHNFNEPVRVNGEEFTVTPDKTAIAETLLQLAYYDGGKKELAKARDFIAERGLHIVAENLDPNITGLFNTFFAFIHLQDPRIKFNKSDYASYGRDMHYDNTVWHEGYHFLQLSRNQGEYAVVSAIDPIVMLGIPYVVYGSVSRYIGFFTEKTTRRRVAAGLTAVPAYFLSQAMLRPTELQAGMRTSPHANLSLEENMGNRRRTLFTVEKVAK